MTTIQDVADQINAKLDQINQNTAAEVTTSNAIKGEIAVTNTYLANIENTLGIDLANISQGIYVVTELQKVEIAYLDYMRRQNDTIICLLENNNDLLCGITRKFTKLLDLTSQQLTLVRKLEGIEERAHAAEAADYDRLLALKSEIEECCPPEQPPPEPCPPACDKPGFRVPDPKVDWKPLDTPRGGSPSAGQKLG